MRAADTNVVVRVIVRDDLGQTAKADTFIADGAWVSHIVLCETLWVLGALYDRTRNQLARVVDMLLSHSTIALQDRDTVEAALKTYKTSKANFADLLILETARRTGHLPLGTFDRNLAKLPGALRL